MNDQLLRSTDTDKYILNSDVYCNVKEQDSNKHSILRESFSLLTFSCFRSFLFHPASLRVVYIHRCFVGHVSSSLTDTDWKSFKETMMVFPEVCRTAASEAFLPHSLIKRLAGQGVGVSWPGPSDACWDWCGSACWKLVIKPLQTFVTESPLIAETEHQAWIGALICSTSTPILSRVVASVALQFVTIRLDLCSCFSVYEAGLQVLRVWLHSRLYIRRYTVANPGARALTQIRQRMLGAEGVSIYFSLMGEAWCRYDHWGPGEGVAAVWGWSSQRSDWL